MYMIFQQYTTAVKSAYAGSPDIAQHLQSARLCREWLESLAIEANLRHALVEPIAVLEEAFQDLAKQE